ncbi:MAG TPA: hypothetical protein VJS91_01160 [Nitrososphaeraceae archaeon]|nr:hypothetical protein [Nitrososphaeraceae archaeon]
MLHIILLLIFLSTLVIFIIASSDFYAESQQAFAESPAFGRETIIDEPSDWLDVWRGINTNNGSERIDIEAVNYYSDGMTLNATLWLSSFSEVPSLGKQVNYGMYIDADLNNETGIKGIDYKVEIEWDNKSKTWTRVFEEWSSTGKSRTLSIKHNFTGFFEKDGDYVLLNVELNDMLFPRRYKVLFYAEEIEGLNWIMDYPKWIYIPPPEFVVSTFPKSIELRAGEQKTIEVKLNSTNGFQPFFHLYNSDASKKKDEQKPQYPGAPEDISFTYKFDNSRISSYGLATVPLTIVASKDATISPHTSFIFANFTFPSEEFFATPIGSSRAIKIDTESIITRYSLTVIVTEPLTVVDQIGAFWGKVGDFINFIYLIGGAIATWLFSTYIKKKRKEKDNSAGMEVT